MVREGAHTSSVFGLGILPEAAMLPKVMEAPAEAAEAAPSWAAAGSDPEAESLIDPKRIEDAAVAKIKQ